MENRHTKAYKRFVLLYHSLAVIIFMGAGILILAAPDSYLSADPRYKTILGILLVIYSLYRLYKAYKKFSYAKEE